MINSIRTKLLIVFSFLLVFCSNQLFSQSSDLQKMMDNPKKLWKYIDQAGFAWELKDPLTAEEGIEGNIAILSFYIKDNEYSTYKDYGGAFIYKESEKASQEEVNGIAQRLYDQLIDSLKEEYAKWGLNLLQPEEYLKTDEQREAYYNFPTPVMDKNAEKWGLEANQSAVPAGYRFQPTFGMGGWKYFNELDDYLEAIGMDVYLVVGIHMSAAGETYGNSWSTIYFRNPDIEEGNEPTTQYRKFQSLEGLTRFEKDFSDIFIKEEQEVVNKKGKVKEQMVPVDIDPNIAKVTFYLTASTGKGYLNYIRKQ